MTEEPLGNHAQFIRGVTFKPTDKCEVGKRDSLVCLRTANVQQTLDESDLIAIPANIVKNPEKLVRLGDILVSSANSWNLVGRCCRVESLRHPSAAGGFISILRADPSRLDPSYLYRWFASDHTQATVRSLGNQTTNISNLDHKRTLSLRIPLPPLPEQKRIAAILDAADALRAKRRESIEQLDSLIQATFLEMFGDPVTNPMKWEEKPLEDIVAETKLGLVRSSEEFGRSFPYPYVRMDAITKEGGFLPETVFATHASTKEREGYALEKGDLLFNTRNSRELVGKTCVFPGPHGWLFNNNIMRIRFRSGVASHCVARQFQFERVRNELEKRKSGTTSVVAVYWKSLRSLPILTPPPDLQHRFAAIVELIKQHKAHMNSHLAELDTLFSSLQSRAFNGELVA